MDEHKSFVTVMQGMNGYFACHVWWNEEDIEGMGFWEPYDTGLLRYAKRSDAIDAAKKWAAELGLEYKVQVVG